MMVVLAQVCQQIVNNGPAYIHTYNKKDSSVKFSEARKKNTNVGR